MSDVVGPAPAGARGLGRPPRWLIPAVLAAAVLLWLIVAQWPEALEDLIGRKKLFLNALFNGITLGALYFLVAAGFTLIFGLMRNVNLAHGTLYLLGGYIGYEVAEASGSWLLSFVVAFVAVALVGIVLQVGVFRRMEGQELRQTLVTIGISIVLADVILWIWGGDFYQILAPRWLSGPMELPLVTGVSRRGDLIYLKYPTVRLAIFAAAVVIGIGMALLLTRTRVGMLIRAGVDDRDMLAATGVNTQAVFVSVFAFGAGLAGLAGVVGGTFQSLAPGEDIRFLLASLVVVIVGGMGSITGAALGALVIGLAEQFGSVYLPTYAVVLTFLILVLVLAFRPQGLMGRRSSPAAGGKPAVRPPGAAPAAPPPAVPPATGQGLGHRLSRWLQHHPGSVLSAAFLLCLPAFASDFVQFQLFGWTFILGMIALSLMFLAGYGGMVSLVQMSVAGLAGYLVAIFGDSGVATISLGWPWWLAVPLAIAIAVGFGTLSGALAVRTAGIYTIMITLAIAAAFFYFARQNYTLFNGFSGFNSVRPPVLFGVDWRDPTAFYYLSLGCAAASFALVSYVARAPFGLALQGVRDNPRRMAAMGFDVTWHRIAAYAFAAAIAAVAGVLLVWHSGQISPGTVGIGPVIDILVIAVVGGLGSPVGPFIGAFLYVVLRTFALDVLVAMGLDGQRFQLLIGTGFLLAVFFSPDGLLGLWNRLKASLGEGRRSLAERYRSPTAGGGR